MQSIPLTIFEKKILKKYVLFDLRSEKGAKLTTGPCTRDIKQ